MYWVGVCAYEPNVTLLFSFVNYVDVITLINRIVWAYRS